MLKALLAAVLSAWCLAAPIDDEILELPGWSPRLLPSKQYSGFVNASSDGFFKMHYWFVECETNPLDAPLVLWFNGGPGASSLFGFLVELGPFLVSDLSLLGPVYQETGIPQLIYNPYGWQKAANILALSMPPPVGFSFCDPPGPSAQGNDCGSWNDTSTADVTYYAIKQWLNKFPEYKSNSMFITGESYAGVYVPMIVKNVLAHPEDNVNLKGFAVGDACTPPDICGEKQYGPYFQIQFLYGKSAFSNRLYEEIMSTCTQDELIHGGVLSIDCSNSVNKMYEEVGGYWVYGFYDDCWYENDFRRRKLLQYKQLWSGNNINNNNDNQNKDKDSINQSAYERPYYGPPIATTNSLHKITQRQQQQRQQRHDISTSDTTIITPSSLYIGGNGYTCGGATVQIEWLNLPSVREALHIPNNATFFQCDNGYDFTYNITEKDLVSWYKEVIQTNQLKILVYNGDTDPCINAFQSQNWTRNLNIPELQSWRSWTSDGCQSVGGYVTRYENSFDFLTIRGSGHMVPQSRPQMSLSFITHFLQGTDYPHYDASCTSPLPSLSDTPSTNTIIETEESLLYEMSVHNNIYEKRMNYLKQRLDSIRKNDNKN